MPEDQEQGPIESGLTDANPTYLTVVSGGKTFADAVGTLIPGVGLIGMLLGHVHNRRVANLVDIARMLDRVLEDQRQRVDQDFLKTADAAAFVEDILTASTRLSEEEKRTFYASAFANGVSLERPDAAARNRMIDVLERLRLPQLRLLAAARTNREFDIPLGAIIDLSVDNGYLQRLIPGTPFDSLILDWHDLRRAGLVENEPIVGSSFPGYSKFITGFGLSFDQFVRAPYDDVHPPPPPATTEAA